MAFLSVYPSPVTWLTNKQPILVSISKLELNLVKLVTSPLKDSCYAHVWCGESETRPKWQMPPTPAANPCIRKKIETWSEELLKHHLHMARVASTVQGVADNLVLFDPREAGSSGSLRTETPDIRKSVRLLINDTRSTPCNTSWNVSMSRCRNTFEQVVEVQRTSCV